MIKKRETCLYCNEKMESKSAKKRFCCALHRVYFNREIKIGKLKIPTQPIHADGSILDSKKEVGIEEKKTNDNSPKSKVMEEMERRVAEIQKQLSNKK